MLSDYARMLDEGKIAIIPAPDERDDEDQKLLEPGITVGLIRETGTICPLGKALHGRRLKFLNSHRPARRYLHFAFAMAILRRQRHEAPGWWKDRLLFADTGCFATAGECIRETTLRRLAVNFGHMDGDEAAGFAREFVGSLDRPSKMLPLREAGEGSGRREELTEIMIEAAYQGQTGRNVSEPKEELHEEDDLEEDGSKEDTWKSITRKGRLGRLSLWGKASATRFLTCSPYRIQLPIHQQRSRHRTIRIPIQST
jgi:hypothetical protein